MLKRGEYLIRQTLDGKLVARVWKDAKLVYNFISCYNQITNPGEDKEQRKSNGEKDRRPLSTRLREFNKFMGV